MEEEEALFILQAESISMMLPDADLEYIFQQLHSLEKEKSGVEIVSNRMLENRNYPKRKEKEPKTSSSTSTRGTFSPSSSVLTTPSLLFFL
jgi:hypothetical protein